jgi:hypothetical protein
MSELLLTSTRSTSSQMLSGVAGGTFDNPIRVATVIEVDNPVSS